MNEFTRSDEILIIYYINLEENTSRRDRESVIDEFERNFIMSIK